MNSHIFNMINGIFPLAYLIAFKRLENGKKIFVLYAFIYLYTPDLVLLCVIKDEKILVKL